MNKERKNLLVFGYGLAAILSFVGVKHWLNHGWDVLDVSFFVCAFVLIILSLVNVYLIKPFYKVWMKVAGMIGHVVTTVILSVLFLFIFGIIGLILRLMKKDLLDRTIDLKRRSYWIKREALFDKHSYERQF